MNAGRKTLSGLLAAALCAAAMPLTPLAQAPDHLVINQVYGGGGKGDTPFSHSFIELYNPTDAAVALDGYTITYSSNRSNPEGKHDGSTWNSDGSVDVVELSLSGSLPSRHAYLIRCAAEETDSPAVTLSDYDREWDQVIDNEKAVEVILYDGETRVDAVSTRDTDFRDVGEGNAPATDEISKQKSLRRTNFSDTDSNAADFRVVVWNALPADPAQRQAFIDTYRPRSLADGEWTESLTPEDEEENPSLPEQDFTRKNDGFENGSAMDLNKIGSYISGYSNKDGGVAEIVSYDAAANKAWVVNGTTGMLDILDLTGVTCGVSDTMTAESLDIKSIVEREAAGFAYGDMTSVAVNSERGIAAVALQEAGYDKNGKVALLDTEGTLLALLDAGCQPDMLTFTPDGSRILVANEGEPREGYGPGIADPAGSVTILTLDMENLAESRSETIGFEAFDGQREQLAADGVMLKKGSLPSADFEPEYIACDDKTAYVALQEANAVAVLDLTTKAYTGVYSLGYKDLSREENAIDLVEDNAYSPKTYPQAVGAYMPDAVSLYSAGGKTYLLTANEGDAREWGKDAAEYVNEIKVTLHAADGSAAEKVRVVDPEGIDGMPEGSSVLFGGRSFSVYCVEADGLTQVFDSGNDFEAKTAAYIPAFFNCSNDDNAFDSRSAKKGPEPESVTVGTVEGRTYAFVALERIGGIMVYDITDPDAVTYSNYINTRDFAEDPDKANPEKNPGFSLTGDFAPEGLYFIDADQSPSSTPILLAAFEVSGTVAAYAVGESPSTHNLDYVPAKEPTTQEAGNREYWVCRSCHRLFADAQGTVETTLAEVTLDKLTDAPDTGVQAPAYILAALVLLGTAALGVFVAKRRRV